MDDQDTMFVAEIYSLYKKIEETIEKYGYQHRVLSSNLMAILNEEDLMSADEELQVKSLYTFNLESKVELDLVKDLMDQLYDQQNPPGLDDMLGDLGISLN